MNFLQILDNAVNDNLEKAAEKKGIAVQELMMVFQESGWQKDADNNQMQLEAIHGICGKVTKTRENKVDNNYTQEYLVYAS
jgi:hypothetical protein